MKIEVLFPEVANLYGDLSNIEYLKKCLNDDVEIIETSLNDEPAFVKQNDIACIAPPALPMGFWNDRKKSGDSHKKVKTICR